MDILAICGLVAGMSCLPTHARNVPELAGLQSPDQATRFAAIKRCGKMSPPATVVFGHLTRQLKTEPFPEHREAILDSLVALYGNDQKVYHVLIQSFDDEHARVRLAALVHITRAGAGAVPALAFALGSERGKIRSGASLALVCFKGDIQQAIPALKKALGGPEEALRVNAAHAFIKLGPKAEAALPELVRALRDPEAGTNAALALGAIGKPAVSLLLQSMKDPDAWVRHRSCYALQGIGPEAEAAIPALKGALVDPDEDVRFFAEWALESILPKK